MYVDPSVEKIWKAWLGLGDGLLLWNPYGAACTLFLFGLLVGYAVHRVATDNKR